MINKLLCFMWGHVYQKWSSYVLHTGVFGEYRLNEKSYHECKHCGKINNGILCDT